MDKRSHAIGAVVLCGLIPSGYILGLVLLSFVWIQKGTSEGLLMILWLALPSSILVALGYSPQLLLHVLLDGLLVGALSLILRNTSSWQLVLNSCLLIGIGGILVLQAITPNLEATWAESLQRNYRELMDSLDFTLSEEEIVSHAKLWARLAPGLNIAIIMFQALIALLVSRGLSSYLYKTGEFKREFYRIQISHVSLIILGIVLLSFIFDIPYALNTIPIVLVPFLFAGFSLAHSLLVLAHPKWFWMFIFYSTLILFLPYVLLLIVFIVILDLYYNFRTRLKIYQ